MHSEPGGPVPSLRPDIQCLLSTWEQAVAANQRTALFSDLSTGNSKVVFYAGLSSLVSGGSGYLK